MIKDFSFARVSVIFTYRNVFASIKTVMELNPLRGKLCTLRDRFWERNRHRRQISFFFSPHKSERIDANTDALPFQLRLCSCQFMITLLIACGQRAFLVSVCFCDGRALQRLTGRPCPRPSMSALLD